MGESKKHHTFLAVAGWILQTSDETGQYPRYMRAAVVSKKHGKVMFNLDGQVLETRQLPSRDIDLLIRGNETTAFKWKRSVLIREPHLPKFYSLRNIDNGALANSALVSVETSHVAKERHLKFENWFSDDSYQVPGSYGELEDWTQLVRLCLVP